MLQHRATRLKIRRKFRRSKRQIEAFGVQTEAGIEKHLFKRITKFNSVRRFILSWMLLGILICGIATYQLIHVKMYYKISRPVAGDTYVEGMVGLFNNANPLFANNEVNATVSKLVFSGLFSYDETGNLVGDLAEKWTISANNSKEYTVTLKPNLVWHDGAALTADDVVFTYKMLQNPDVRSPYFTSWAGIDVKATDAKTVVFTLPNIIASFPYSLTNGVIPKHLLQNIAPEAMRSDLFNTANPVGSGPFRWKSVDVIGSSVDNREQKITLIRNENYFKGAPKLDGFTLRTFTNEKTMNDSFLHGEINALVSPNDLIVDQDKDSDIEQRSLLLNGAVTIYLKNDQDILKDVLVRQALTQATNQREIAASLSYPTRLVDAPLLQTMVGYNVSLSQLPFDVSAANTTLDKAGWVRAENGIRVKDGKELTLVLYTLNTTELASVATILSRQWQQAGVSLVVKSISQTDLEGVIERREYDVLMYGVSLGKDPDVFAYWHSSQFATTSPQRLNFSDYNSLAADIALEAGRTRVAEDIRAAKYKTFLQAWRNDAPAIMLYRPRLLYVTKGEVYNFDNVFINSSYDRLYGVENWMIKTALVDK
jgi:peptide/nickel transport system substrate-binding protein